MENKALWHITQTILANIVDINNQVRQAQDNPDLDVDKKKTMSDFGNYHLATLGIILHEIEDYARTTFTDAKNIIDWSMEHYNWGVNNKIIKLCECPDCKVEEKVEEKVDNLESAF